MYQPTIYEQSATGKSPEFYDEAAYRWIINNASMFKDIQRIIYDLWESGCKMVRRGDVFGEAKRLKITYDNQFSQNNNIWSSLVRYIIDIHPELSSKNGGPLSIRSCALDDIKRRPLDWRYIYKRGK